MFIAALFIIANIRYPSGDEWIKKMWYIYAMDDYSAIKKERNPVIFSNMNETRDH
jgi:hypothetical protein